MGTPCVTCKKKPGSKNIFYSNNENNLEINNIILNIKKYDFFTTTKRKNDYFIECDLTLLKTDHIQKIKKYLEKWAAIISLSRTERKISHKYLPIDQENYKDIKKETFLSHTNNQEIKVYTGKDKFFSDLVVKLQIALFYNKEIFIRYLSKGPPNNLRWATWLSIAMTDLNNNFILLEDYKNLTEKKDLNFDKNYDDQIKKDINRSNIGLEFLQEKKSFDCLYRILKALAIIDPELGYCQGMNIITANLLMISDFNELETFNMMNHLLQNLELREFFINGFPKLLMFIFIFKEFIKDQYPQINNKLDNLDIPEELWIFKWMQTLFFLTLPLSISIRIIDCILCFGLEFLLNFSLSFVKENEKKILSCDDVDNFIDLFKGPEIDQDIEEQTFENKNLKNETREKVLENKKVINKNIDNNHDYFNSKYKNYFQNIDFTKDLISFREKLLRNAKNLNIRELIDKMIDNYSQNNPVIFSNPDSNYENTQQIKHITEQNNFLNNPSNQEYDYQNTIQLRDIKDLTISRNESSEDEEKNSIFYKKNSVSNSHSQIKEENLGHLENDEYSQRKKNKFSISEINKDNQSMNSKSLQINIDKTQNIFTIQDLNKIPQDYLNKEIFKTKNNLVNNFVTGNRKTNINTNKIIFSSTTDKNRSVKFDPIENFNSVSNTNRDKKAREISSMEENFEDNLISTVNYCNTERENTNSYYNKIGFFQKTSGTSASIHTFNNVSRKTPLKNQIRQSLNINFGRRLSIEQIVMMNKIKSKMNMIKNIGSKDKNIKNLNKNFMNINQENSINKIEVELLSDKRFEINNKKLNNITGGNQDESFKKKITENIDKNQISSLENKINQYSNHKKYLNNSNNYYDSDDNLNNYRRNTSTPYSVNSPFKKVDNLSSNFSSPLKIKYEFDNSNLHSTIKKNISYNSVDRSLNYLRNSKQKNLNFNNYEYNIDTVIIEEENDENNPNDKEIQK